MTKREYCVGRTVVNGRVSQIWRRNETHEHGRRNGKPDNLWLKQTWEDGSYEWIPWIDLATKRPCFEVKIVESNRTKNKWGETYINGRCYVEIWCNKTKVYDFGCLDIEYALAKAQVTIAKMQEHPFKFSDPESELGRKIWFYQQPATIKSLILDQGCIMIEKEGGEPFDLSRPWDREDEKGMGWDGECVVKDDIFSKNIHWFRREDG